MSFSVDILANVTIELQRGIGHQDCFQRLIITLRQALEYDASALLRHDLWQFIPFATDRLAEDILGRCFTLEGHPRLEVTVRADDIVRFPAGNELSDPYDGLISRQENLKVHVCVGLPLFTRQNLIGVLTLDGMQPDQFDIFGDEELWLIVALAAGALSNALLVEQLESQNVLPGDAASFEAVKQTQMIGLSLGMTQSKKEIEIVAVSDLNVLINGETGASKGLMAKAIRETSLRAVDPLVYLNCTASPENVAENGLSGHMKGAFTSAISNRSGKFEMAGNGMLFLDEIGELPLALQVKLLRVLQYGGIQRVGDDRNLRVDMRVLAATNHDLRREVLAERFRADLFHRLNVFPLSVSPLHERDGDVTLLARYFCGQCRLRLRLSRVILSAGARNLLQHYNSLGNMRELEHAIHRAVVLPRATRSGGEVILETQHFAFPEVTLPPPEAAAAPVVKQNLRGMTEMFQYETIRQTLVQSHHNWVVCTRMLEINVANLYWLAGRPELKD